MLTDTLKSIVGDGGWTDDAHDLEPHLTEWRDTWRGNTLLMVSPQTTDEVAAVPGRLSFPRAVIPGSVAAPFRMLTAARCCYRWRV